MLTFSDLVKLIVKHCFLLYFLDSLVLSSDHSCLLQAGSTHFFKGCSVGSRQLSAAFLSKNCLGLQEAPSQGLTGVMSQALERCAGGKPAWDKYVEKLKRINHHLKGCIQSQKSTFQHINGATPSPNWLKLMIRSKGQLPE